MQQNKGIELKARPGPGDTVVIPASKTAADHYNNGIVTTRCICCGGPVHATELH